MTPSEEIAFHAKAVQEHYAANEAVYKSAGILEVQAEFIDAHSILTLAVYQETYLEIRFKHGAPTAHFSFGSRAEVREAQERLLVQWAAATNHE